MPSLFLILTHSRDSDSNGCTTGHILGALHGVEAISQRQLDLLGLKDAVDIVATDLYRTIHDSEALDDVDTSDFDRHPDA